MRPGVVHGKDSQHCKQPLCDSRLSSLTVCDTSAADGDSVLEPVSFWVAGGGLFVAWSKTK